ncbi:MAG: thiol:disulfide interchange protein DsbA/DsbL [Steroidobacteraceae bacterium]
MSYRIVLTAIAVLLTTYSVSSCGRNTEQAATAPAAAGSSEAPPESAAAAPAEPANTAGSAETSAAAAVEETTGEEQTADSAPLAALTAPAAKDRLPNGRWKAGVNYQPISPAQPTMAAPGKVEVLEVFWYGCSHCYALDPFLENWKAKSKPSYVEFTRVPVIWGPAHRAHARLFYALKALGKLDELHGKVFDAIHRQGNSLLGNNEADSVDVQAKFLAGLGVDPKAFRDAANSFAVNTELQRADQVTRRFSVTGVPDIIVNGKYKTDVGMAGGHAELLTLLNDLAAAEKQR